MPKAARVTDLVSHPLPPVLGAGPGSPNVLIGMLPAWRALPGAVGAALDGLSNAMDSFMSKPAMTPADAAADLAQAQQKMGELAGQCAAEGNAGVAATAAAQTATLNATNTTLTTTWTSASAVPGGQPAANQAYTEGIKAAAGAAATAVVAAMAGMSDMHTCTTPAGVVPHGPGFVTKGSSSVVINNLPACRQNDQVMEACGGSDPISMGFPTVDIGDAGGGGSSGAGGGGASSAPQGAAAALETPQSDTAADAFSSAAESGTPLISRRGCDCPDA